MNERIKEIVEQTGVTMDNVYACYERDIERFVKLVRADEREACAKLCEDLQLTDLCIRDWADGTYDCAKAIRARGEK
jgi:hypothetical protein